MKITIDIKNNQFATFIAFLKTLDYVSITNQEDTIPKWQIKETAKRLKALKKNPEKAIDFDKTLENIEKKHGL